MTLEEFITKLNKRELYEITEYEINVQTDIYFTMSDKPETTRFKLKEIEVNDFDKQITLIGDNK